MTAASVLSSALSLIENPTRWAQHHVALDRYGNEVAPRDERAARFCMVGAIQRVQSSSDDYGAAIRALRKACGDQSIFEFNDGHGHRSVVKAMKRAIGAARAA